MKTLYVLRHAKSSWDDPTLQDHDRPLAPRGLKAAPVMAKVLASFENPPTHAVSSTAKRAYETAKIVKSELQEKWNHKMKLVTDSRLYAASDLKLIEVLRSLPDDVEDSLLVGHNPEMESLVSMLCTGHREGEIRMPTAALACIRFEIATWSALRPGEGMLIALLIPKLIQSMLAPKKGT